MKKAILIITLLYSTQLIAQKPTGTESSDPWAQQINKVVGSYLGTGNGALAIGFIRKGKQQILYFGKKSDKKSLLPDGADIFEIGELTETFTSILLADEAIKGEMRIDGSLGDYLNKDVNNFDEKISILQKKYQDDIYEICSNNSIYK